MALEAPRRHPPGGAAFWRSGSSTLIRKGRILLDRIKKMEDLSLYLTRQNARIEVTAEDAFNGPLYNEFQIKKSSGGYRLIRAPKPNLMRIQRLLHAELTIRLMESPIAHGFYPGRSIVTNAHPHVGKKYIYNFDLKDFFANISAGSAQNIWREALPDSPQDIVLILTLLTSTKFGLAQGAPTSPILSNMHLRIFDKKFDGICREQGVTCTRYADDITLSFNDEPSNIPKIFEGTLPTLTLSSEIKSLLKDFGQTIHPTKSRLQHTSRPQMVTGLVVNQRLNLPAYRTRRFRAMLHSLANHGVSRAARIHFNAHSKTRVAYRRMNSHFISVCEGELALLKMVWGASDPRYVQYRTVFDLCRSRNFLKSDDVPVLQNSPRSSSPSLHGSQSGNVNADQIEAELAKAHIRLTTALHNNCSAAKVKSIALIINRLQSLKNSK